MPFPKDSRYGRKRHQKTDANVARSLFLSLFPDFALTTSP